MQPYLWDPWSSARIAPDRKAVLADGEECTFDELTIRADALASGLRALGLPDGAIVSTDIPTGPGFFAVALAALRYGFGFFPIGRHLLQLPMGANLLTEAKVRLHITAEPPPAQGSTFPCPVVTDAALLGQAATAPVMVGPRPFAGHLVFATSGTTGLPQAVVRVRPKRPYKGVAVVARYGAGISCGPHLMANPTYHLGTLGPALYALQAGSTVVVQRTWSSALFAELADRHQADSVMLSPDRLLDVVETRSAPARPFQVVFHGGAACPPAVKRKAIDLFGPVLHEYYGTSESVITEITTSEWLAHPGSVGRPLPGIGIDITRDGSSLAAGETGEIRLRLRAADRNRSDASTVETGDVGYLDSDGYLFVIGRAQSSRELLTARLESDIRLLPGVTDVVVLDGDRPVCFVEHSQHGVSSDTKQAIEATASLLELPPVQVVLATSGSFPRTPSGKIARATLALRVDDYGIIDSELH